MIQLNPEQQEVVDHDGHSLVVACPGSGKTRVIVVKIGHILSISHGRKTNETIQAVAPHLDIEAETRRHHQAEIEDTEGVLPIAGARALLAGLPANRWAIVTACPRPLALARIQAAGILDRLPNILVTAEQVRSGKPNPECFLTGARALGFDPCRCLVFEDAPSGIQAGHAAGMRVVGVTTTFPAERLEADTCIRDFSHLDIECHSNGLMLEIP